MPITKKTKRQSNGKPTPQVDERGKTLQRLADAARAKQTRFLSEAEVNAEVAKLRYGRGR